MERQKAKARKDSDQSGYPNVQPRMQKKEVGEGKREVGVIERAAWDG